MRDWADRRAPPAAVGGRDLPISSSHRWSYWHGSCPSCPGRGSTCCSAFVEPGGEPFIRVELGNLARLTGDEPTRQRELREIARLARIRGSAAGELPAGSRDHM